MNAHLDALWQRSKANARPSDLEWYVNQRVGDKTLGSFMTKLSAAVNLSQKYTNHSLRVTGITLLLRSSISSKQIMAVSGHKSVSSLAIYQRVSEKEKVAMGDCIGSSLLGQPTSAQVPAVMQAPVHHQLGVPAQQASVAPVQQHQIIMPVQQHQLGLPAQASMAPAPVQRHQLSLPAQAQSTLQMSQTQGDGGASFQMQLGQCMPYFNNCCNITVNVCVSWRQPHVESESIFNVVKFVK